MTDMIFILYAPTLVAAELIVWSDFRVSTIEPVMMYFKNACFVFSFRIFTTLNAGLRLNWA